MIIRNDFLLILHKTICCGHNIWFWWELRKIIVKYSLLSRAMFMINPALCKIMLFCCLPTYPINMALCTISRFWSLLNDFSFDWNWFFLLKRAKTASEFTGAYTLEQITMVTRHRKRYNPLALYHSSYWSHCWMDTHFLMYLLRVL